MKPWFKVARMIAVFGQVGFSLITPPILMAWLGWWLWQRLNLGVWIIALFLVLGLLSSAGAARGWWKKFRSMARQEEEKDHPVTFYRHE